MKQGMAARMFALDAKWWMLVIAFFSALAGNTFARHFNPLDSQTGVTLTIFLDTAAHPTLNGTPISSNNLGVPDEIGVFDSVGNCWGVGNWPSGPTGIFPVAGYNNTGVVKPGLKSGAVMHFRVWDSTLGEMPAAVTYYPPTGPVPFPPNFTPSTESTFVAGSPVAYSVPMSIVGLTVPGVPGLSAPANGASNQATSLTFSWTSSSGGAPASYGMMVSTVSTFASTLVSQAGIIGTSTALSGLANSTTYYWEVNATNSSGTSAWSGVWSFTTFMAPTLASPVNGSINEPTSLTMNWGMVPGASTYSAIVSTATTFGTTVSSQSSMTGTSASLSGLANSTTYYWKASATNAGGTGPWSSAWSFTTIIAPPTAPVLSTPLNGTVNEPVSLVMSWGAVTGAASYSVLVSTAANFATTVSSQTGLTGVSASLSGLANNTTYYWEVNATNVGGTSAWTGAWNFVTILATPTPAAPASGAINQPISLTMSWSSVLGASSYSILVSTAASFSSTVASQQGLTGATASLAGLANSEAYYWKVNAANASGTSAWSGAWSFTTIIATPVAPGLINPASGVTNEPISPTFTWGSVTGASTYSFLISTSATFATTVSSQTNLAGLTVSLSSLANGTTYYWEANATNIGGTGPWSGVWSFTTIIAAPAAPAQTLPTNGTGNQTLSPSLSWSSDATAASYGILVSTNSKFGTTVFSQTNLTVLSTMVTGLTNSTQYFWEVNATNIGGTSAWSSVWSFLTVPFPPNPPTLSLPLNGSTTPYASPTLSWGTVSGAVSYGVQIATVSNFSTTVFNAGGATTSNLSVSGLASSTTFYWQANATNTGGTGNWSNIWSFTTIASIPPATPILTSPTNGSSNMPISLNLAWNTLVTAYSYQVQVSTDGAFGSLVLQDSSITTGIRLVSGLANSTQYYWRVRAKNDYGVSSWASASFQTIIAAPATPSLSGPANSSINLPISLTLTWGTVATASNYLIQISTSSAFATYFLQDSSLTAGLRAVSGLTNNLTYYWEVRASNIGGSSGWAGTWSFMTMPLPPAIPGLGSPSNDATNQPISPALTWNTASGAVSYSLQVATISTFSTTVISQSGLSVNSEAVGPLAFNMNYYWFVQATNAGGQSPWSSVWNFTTITGIPALSSPSNASANQPVSLALSWSSINGAASYGLQVTTVSDFSTTVFSLNGLTASSQTLSGLANNTNFYWRTNAASSVSVSAWSNAWIFSTIVALPVTPILVQPSNGVIAQSISLTLSWNTVANAATYRVQAATDSLFSSILLDDSTITMGSRALSGLSNGTLYYWHVLAKDYAGLSSWSSIWNFTTVTFPPPVPVLSMPSNGATNQPTSLTLSWNTGGNASLWFAQVSTSSSFSTFLLQDSVLTTNFQPLTGLANNTVYYWQVNATNSGGGRSNWTGVWSFVTAPATPVLAIPTNGAFAQPTSLSLSWGTAAGAASYGIQVSTGAAFASTVVNQTGVTATAIWITGLANNTPYYWQVNAANQNGAGGWSGVWSFWTIFAPPVQSFPTNGAIGQAVAPSLSWGAVTGALSYGIQVSTNSSFSTTVASQTGVTLTSTTLSGLLNNVTYYWEVNASNAGGASAWSSFWTFSTIVSAPALALPANGAIGQAVLTALSWGSVAGAASYSLQVSTTSTFSTTCFSQAGLTSTSIVPGGLAYYTVYYWEANAANAGGTGLWSGAWSFTTAAHLAVPISSGWFMYSLNINPADSSTGGVFGKLKGFILAMDGSDNLYWPGASLDEIGTIHTGSGYWILDTLGNDTLNLTGSAVNVGSTAVSLPASTWNLVSYLPQVNMPIAQALAPINSQLVLAMDGSSNFYWPAAALDEIGTMWVGSGYYILTSATTSLTYPSAGSSPAKELSATPDLAKLLKPPAPAHFAKRALTGNFAAFLAPHVEFGGKIAADKCEVGAYDTKGNLVGSGTVVNGLTAFAICGKDPRNKAKNGCIPSEKITFKLWNGKTEYPLVVTRGSEPVYAARTILSATLAVPAGALISAFNLSRAYPNPFKGSVNIAFDVPIFSGVSQHAVEIDIFDMKGSLVKQLAKGVYLAGHYELPWNCNIGREAAVGSSLYIVRMKAANFEKRLKLVRVQ